MHENVVCKESQSRPYSNFLVRRHPVRFQKTYELHNWRYLTEQTFWPHRTLVAAAARTCVARCAANQPSNMLQTEGIRIRIRLTSHLVVGGTAVALLASTNSVCCGWMNICVYVWVYVCVRVCFSLLLLFEKGVGAHPLLTLTTAIHTHTHIIKCWELFSSCLLVFLRLRFLLLAFIVNNCVTLAVPIFRKKQRIECKHSLNFCCGGVTLELWWYSSYFICCSSLLFICFAISLLLFYLTVITT